VTALECGGERTAAGWMRWRAPRWRGRPGACRGDANAKVPYGEKQMSGSQADMVGCEWMRTYAGE
jgi:hypothetical protein